MKLPWGHSRNQRLRLGWRSALAFAVVVSILAFAIFLRPRSLSVSQPLAQNAAEIEVVRLQSVSAFSDINDPAERSVALFEEAGRVIQHPRCMNCHPRTDRPTQTDSMRPHTPWVSRGPDGGGEPTLRCSSCHHADNFETSGVPGNPHWALAPIEMGWQGLTLGEICRQIQDPSRGGMTHEELLLHMAEDELVGWAWRPGGGRTSAPGTQEEFGALIGAWIATGAGCPE